MKRALRVLQADFAEATLERVVGALRGDGYAVTTGQPAASAVRRHRLGREGSTGQHHQPRGDLHSDGPAGAGRSERRGHARHDRWLRHRPRRHAHGHRRRGGVPARPDSTFITGTDLLVDGGVVPGLFDEIALRLELSDLLGTRVGVVGTDDLRGVVRDRVLGEAVPL